MYFVDVTYNIHLNEYFVFRSEENDIISGDGETFNMLAERPGSFGLQVDWIGRRLFWVEEVRKLHQIILNKIVSVVFNHVGIN